MPTTPPDTALRMPPPDRPRSPEDQIDAWLDVLVRLLDLPASEREGLRDELAAHLHERVRDLTLAGTDPTQAVTRAIAELGDQAELARALRAARHTPRRRRTLMLAGLIGTSAAAMLISTAALVQTSTAPRTAGTSPTTAATATAVANADAPGVLETPITGIYDNERVVDVLHDLANQVGRTDAQFSRNLTEHLSMILEPGGEPAFARVTASFDRVPLEDAVRRLSVAMHYEEHTLQARDRGDHLFFAFRGEFDQMEAHLLTHDLGPLLDLGLTPSEIHGVLTQFVEPDEWRYNGGTFAIEIVRDKALVEAPPRMHVGVEHTLATLRASFAREPDDPRSRAMDLAQFVPQDGRKVSQQTFRALESVLASAAATYPESPTPAVAVNYDENVYTIYGNLHQRELARRVVEGLETHAIDAPFPD